MRKNKLTVSSPGKLYFSPCCEDVFDCLEDGILSYQTPDVIEGDEIDWTLE